MSSDINRQSLILDIEFGKELLPVEVIFSDRQNLRITVLPDLRIKAYAPDDRPSYEIEKKLQKRARWIKRKLDYFKRFQPLLPPRRYVSGETHYYLGRQYRLKVNKSDEESVKLKGRFFQVFTKRPENRDHVRKLMNRWYRIHAVHLLKRRINLCHESIKRWKIPSPKVKFRRMAKRWGSCNSNGTILINTELVKAPVHCIDYVITHEMCHLRFPHHDKDFYSLLSLRMPDWRARKTRLEKVVI